ncbi:MAG: DUF4115 domain-containing protein [Candidatus Thiodiazotropha sp. (ex Ctena orbiculata)]|nr:DUF4115 domain-containing protein [Candidatus Thiodiazotropha taylori]
MNQAENDNQDRGESATEQGPGSLLKRARERQQMSAASVAAQLHLQSNIIDALERDDYDNLPGPVFVQGYIRNYARLVGLQEDAVVAAYQRLFPEFEEQTILNSPEQGEGKTIHSGQGLMRLVTWGVVIALAALLFFWWQTQAELEPPEPFPITEESQPQELPMVEPSADTAGQIDAVDERQTEPVLLDDPLPELEEMAAPPQNEALEEAVAADPQSQPSSPTPVAAEPQSEPEVEQTEPARIEPVAVVEESPTVESRSKSLLFSFEGPCWTEVRSLDGKARIIGEMRSGAKRRLSSEYGPFSVVLGDVAVVTLTIDGQPFDLAPFTRGKVARFTLDPDQL